MLPQWSGICPHWELANHVISFRNPKDGTVVWQSNPGRQTEALWANECEVLYGGARGGGKSQALMAWMVKGNFDLPQDHPCFATVLNHPNFKGLILRRNATDLREFIDEITPFYTALGGTRTEEGFKWKKLGATIYLGHLDSDDAFEKYKGWNLARIGVEELTQVKDQKRYLKLLGSCRTSHPELRPKWSDAVGQIFSTTNPDGDGHKWVKRRFVEVQVKGGALIQRGSPMRDPYTGLTRVFIPAKRSDNPKLGSGYDAVLRAQAESDPALERAWLDGDWNIHSGQYFDNFRPNGPLTGEPPWACHVVKKATLKLMPWWPRYIGVDWGFRHEAAVYWICHNQQDGRLYVYDEMVVQKVGSHEFGAMIARRTMPDLTDDCPHVPLFLSHERFNVNDEGPTMAEQIAAGMNMVLGAGAVLVAQKGDKDRPVTDDYNTLAENKAKISMHPQGRDRVAGWQYIYNLMQFQEVVDLGEPDQAYIDLLMKEGNHVKIEKYVQAYDKRNKRKIPLPAILYADCAPKLIQQLQDAIHDEREGKRAEDILEDGKEHSNDRLDGLRHGVMGIRKREEKIPKREYMARRMDTVPDEVKNDPTRLWQVTAKAESDYTRQHAGKMKPFNLSRPN